MGDGPILRVGDKAYRIAFEDFGCTGVDEWDGKKPVDCVISASDGDWRELIEHIQARGTADARHTLNSLVLAGDRLCLGPATTAISDVGC